MTYRLTVAAEEDLLEIYVEGARRFGLAQAGSYHRDLESAFETIAKYPNMARERTELSPPVRIHPHGSHIIVYLTDDAGDVLIVRVRHGHEDWETDPA